MFNTDQQIIIKGTHVSTGTLIAPFTAVRIKTVGVTPDSPFNPVLESAVATAVRADQPVGISTDVLNKLGGLMNITMFGRTKMRLGAASGPVTPGQWLAIDAAGCGIPATAGQYSLARAMSYGTSGELIRVLVYPALTPA